ncbi:Phosphohistidine phosphatase SixA [Pseudomonas cuatrocienegasensis]|uniref:Phosphohistidine phosphatase SixA n=1 Tax=Pseudomonas cuatrocienegasensis TaxID=543360 RepID=A0ABY1B190_9PSED|nr:histidine phosphatase family protein [Pseudomonas sp. 21C1]SEP68130.1 Phosphohistidine phosphatase SixA [Pseudomonas cuatrocienegasensis]
MASFVASVSALCLMVGLLSSGLAQADEQQAWAALREGRALLLLRHATAPGVGDPAGFTLGDCSTQRNLNEQGRAEGRRWGERLRGLGIERPQLLSSRWCRARDTAQAMDLGPVEPLPPLDSFFENRTTANQQIEALLAQINALPAGVARVLVSHQVNITALTGIYPASGEGLILALPLTRPAKVLARIDPP